MKRYFRITQSKAVLNGWCMTGIAFRPGLPNRLYFVLGIGPDENSQKAHAMRQLDDQLERDGITADHIVGGENE
jgi:hypothetical protein